MEDVRTAAGGAEDEDVEMRDVLGDCRVDASWWKACSVGGYRDGHTQIYICICINALVITIVLHGRTDLCR